MRGTLREISDSILEQPLFTIMAKLREFLAGRCLEAYVVGGFIRDAMLRRSCLDIDIAVAARASEVAQELASAWGGKFVLLDEANQVARVVLHQATPEAKRLFLDFSTLRGSIEEDLAQRDFTINAMAVDLQRLGQARPEIIDPLAGQRDLELGLIRAVRDSVFQDDQARLLRAVRLAAEFHLTIEEGTQSLIRRYSPLVVQVAGERVREELCRLLSLPRAASSLCCLDRLGLLTSLIPELAQAKGVTQPLEHFWEVFDHSIETVAALEFLLRIEMPGPDKASLLADVPWSPDLAQHFDEEVGSGNTRGALLKLAGLLHDIAKPSTKCLDDEGRTRFFGHAKEGATIARQIMERLRFSGRETRMVETIIQHHLRPTQMADGQLPTPRAIYRFFRDTGDVGIDILFLSLADHLATRGPNLIPAYWKQHVEIVRHVLAGRARETGVVRPLKLIDGHDLINIFGLTPGPDIGRLLEMVREAQAAGEITSREEALDLVRGQFARARHQD